MRRWWAGGVAVLAVFVLSACRAEETAGPGPGPFPSSMAALGDSITAGFGTCLVLADCPRNSWATGTGAIVSSHYKRILSGNAAIKGHVANYAEAGARRPAAPAPAGRAGGAGPPRHAARRLRLRVAQQLRARPVGPH